MSNFEHSPIRILLDMDGVVVDFHREALRRLGFDPETRFPTLVDYKIAKNLGMSEEAFYSWLNNVGSDFWADLPFTPYGKSLYQACTAIAPTYFCTSPTHDEYCAPGKLRWMFRHLGPRFNRYSIGSHKHLQAGHGHILIDDAEKNIEAFRKEAELKGGHAILYPRPWNSGKIVDEAEAYEKVMCDLRQVVNELSWSIAI